MFIFLKATQYSLKMTCSSLLLSAISPRNSWIISGLSSLLEFHLIGKNF